MTSFCWVKMFVTTPMMCDGDIPLTNIKTCAGLIPYRHTLQTSTSAMAKHRAKALLGLSPAPILLAATTAVASLATSSRPTTIPVKVGCFL